VIDSEEHKAFLGKRENKMRDTFLVNLALCALIGVLIFTIGLLTSQEVIYGIAISVSLVLTGIVFCRKGLKGTTRHN